MQIRFSFSVKSINIIFRISFQNQNWENHKKLSFYFLFFFPLFPAIPAILHLPYFYHFTPFPLPFSFFFLPPFYFHSIPILLSILLTIFKLFILHRFFYYRSKNLVPRKSHGIPVNYGEVRKTLKVSER